MNVIRDFHASLVVVPSGGLNSGHGQNPSHGGGKSIRLVYDNFQIFYYVADRTFDVVPIKNAPLRSCKFEAVHPKLNCRFQISLHVFKIREILIPWYQE